VKRRIRCGWLKWREASECDKRIPTRPKRKFYKSVVSVLGGGQENRAKNECRRERMLRRTSGMTGEDRNEYVRGSVGVALDKTRENGRLRWSCWTRRDDSEAVRTVMSAEG